MVLLLHAVAQYLSINFYKRSGCSAGVIGAHVLYWEGGTGIIIALKESKTLWARLVLLLSPVVLFITDGLEREEITQLQAEIARLALRARQLMGLDPLLRWDQFPTQAAGIGSILPHVPFFINCHNLDSLQELYDDLRDGFSSDHKKDG